MRRTLSLASLLLMGAAVALPGEERSSPFLPYKVSPEVLNSMTREPSERVSPYIVGGEVSEQGTHTAVFAERGMGRAGRFAARACMTHSRIILTPTLY